MDHISSALADQAWERYEQASAHAARYITGQQLDLVEVIEERDARAFWFETYLACERVALSETSLRNAAFVVDAKEGSTNA
ncbi:hypothetical protein [Lysobacter sp. Hz 25]|uniref:hypothetical protein n=1 Tax=Lysobacter sp. Hz 25 TaxID=3383698 RepID=UPI0038D42DEA